MHDVLTPAEKVLAQNGNHTDVRASHLEPDVAAEIFVLDAPV
jgi:hypothetical protein